MRLVLGVNTSVMCWAGSRDAGPNTQHLCALLAILCAYPGQLRVQQRFPHQAVGVARNRAVGADPAVRAHAHAQRLTHTDVLVQDENTTDTML